MNEKERLPSASAKRGDGSTQVQIAALDLMRYILSIFVVAIHVHPVYGAGNEVIRAVCRIAVPLFFITSGYLFFLKTSILGDEKERLKYLCKYIKRVLFLYLAWFIVLLPITVYTRGWLHMSFFQLVSDICYRFFFGATFKGSWYLMALIVGTVIIFLISRKFNNKVLLLIGIATYLVCCGFAGYGNLLGLNPLNDSADIFNSFPASIVWIVIGKYLAENRTKEYSSRYLGIMVGLSAILYSAETYICVSSNWAKATDCMLFLIPLCSNIFICVLKSSVDLEEFGPALRAISSVTYCLHISLSIVISFLLEKILHFSFDNSCELFTRFLLVLIICNAVGAFIYHLGNGKHKLLKYFY